MGDIDSELRAISGAKGNSFTIRHGEHAIEVTYSTDNDDDITGLSISVGYDRAARHRPQTYRDEPPLVGQRPARTRGGGYHRRRGVRRHSNAEERVFESHGLVTDTAARLFRVPSARGRVTAARLNAVPIGRGSSLVLVAAVVFSCATPPARAHRPDQEEDRGDRVQRTGAPDAASPPHADASTRPLDRASPTSRCSTEGRQSSVAISSAFTRSAGEQSW